MWTDLPSGIDRTFVFVEVRGPASSCMPQASADLDVVLYDPVVGPEGDRVLVKALEGGKYYRRVVALGDV